MTTDLAFQNALLSSTVRLPRIPPASAEMASYLAQLHEVIARLQLHASRAVAILNQFRIVAGPLDERPEPTDSRVTYVDTETGDAWIDVGTEWVQLGHDLPDLSIYAVRDADESFQSLEVEEDVDVGGNLTVGDDLTVAGFSFERWPTIETTNNYGMTASDFSVAVTGGVSATVTLPPAAGLAGKMVRVRKAEHPGAVTIESDVLIEATSAMVLTIRSSALLQLNASETEWGLV